MVLFPSLADFHPLRWPETALPFPKIQRSKREPRTPTPRHSPLTSPWSCPVQNAADFTQEAKPGAVAGLLSEGRARGTVLGGPHLSPLLAASSATAEPSPRGSAWLQDLPFSARMAGPLCWGTDPSQIFLVWECILLPTWGFLKKNSSPRMTSALQLADWCAPALCCELPFHPCPCWAQRPSPCSCRTAAGSPAPCRPPGAGRKANISPKSAGESRKGRGTRLELGLWQNKTKKKKLQEHKLLHGGAGKASAHQTDRFPRCFLPAHLFPPL